MSKFRCEPQVRGSLVLSRLEYLRNQGATVLLDQVLSQLAPADAGMLRRSVRPASWYPLSVQLRLDDAIASVLSFGDRAEAFVEVGRAYADAILARSHRQKATRGTPKVFLETVPRLYHAYYTVGRREYEPLGDNAAVIRTFDAEGLVIADHCWTVVGCLQRGLELSGADTVLVTETACRSSGASCCQYLCEWDFHAAAR